MDAIDLKILDLLQKDGRTSHSEIAKLVGLSAPSVGERVKKLESTGVIRRYVSVLDPNKVNRPITAIIAVSLDKPHVHASAPPDVARHARVPRRLHAIDASGNNSAFVLRGRLERPAHRSKSSSRSIHAMTFSTPSPDLRLVNTNGRSPRAARESRSITSRLAPT